MSYQYIKGAISCSRNTQYTGSFVEIQCIGPNGSGSLARVEYGRLTNPETSTIATGVGDNFLAYFDKFTTSSIG